MLKVSNIFVLIWTILILLVSLFEYGSYKITPILFTILLAIFFIRKIIFRQNVFKIIMYTLLILFTIYFRIDFHYSEFGKIMSLVSWSLLIPLAFLILGHNSFYKSLSIVFYILFFFCLVDLLLYSFIHLDFSGYLGVESRHITLSKPYIRSTGLFAEPGTQATAFIIILLFIKNIPKKIWIIYTVAVFLILSPYMLLGYIRLVKLRYFIIFIISIIFISFILENRIYNIYTLQDTSALARAESLSLLYDSLNDLNIIFKDNGFLVTDLGFYIELFVELGAVSFVLYLILFLFSKSHIILLLLKVKAYSGWLPLFVFYKSKRN